MADKEKNQIPDDKKESDDAGSGTPTEDESTPELDKAGPVETEETQEAVDAHGDETVDSSATDEDDIDKTSDDSIENQDGYEDYYEGYGEEYYMRDPYDKNEGKDESDPADKSSASEKSNDRGDDGGDDGGDDDDDENIPEGNPEKKMPFLEHLEELRWTLMRSLIAIVIGAIIAFFFSEYIISALKALAPEDKMTLVILGPTDGFVTVIKVAMFSGLVLALPFVAYEFWKFIVPGLLQKEKKLVPPIVFFTVVCFLSGAAFAYFVILNFALDFLLNFLDQTENMIAVGKYLGFVVTIILVFGVVFELPVLSFFLSSIGLLTPDFLRNNRRYGIVIIFIMAALLTPPDISTQLLLAGPLIILYEISIWVSAAVVRRKKEAEEDDE